MLLWWCIYYSSEMKMPGKISTHHNLAMNMDICQVSTHWGWELRENAIHFPDIFKYIFMKEKVWIPLKISLKFVPKVRINNMPALVQTTAWRRPGDKPLSDLMVVNLLTHTCVTRPHWDNTVGVRQRDTLQMNALLFHRKQRNTMLITPHLSVITMPESDLGLPHLTHFEIK